MDVKTLVRQTYRGQKRRSKLRGHSPPKYTFDELYKWIISQSNFKELYNNWIKSSYQKDLIPSVDRLDDDKGYSFDNIQLITWKENRQKECDKRKKKVNQYTIEGKYIKTWESYREAERKTEIQGLNRACNDYKTYKHVGWYQWRYVDDGFKEGENIEPLNLGKSKYRGVAYDYTYKKWKSGISYKSFRFLTVFKNELQAAYFSDLVLNYFDIKGVRNNVKILKEDELFIKKRFEKFLKKYNEKRNKNGCKKFNKRTA